MENKEYEYTELTEEKKKEILKNFVHNFSTLPTEQERKNAVYACLNTILQALGSYTNDDKLEFKRIATADRELLRYKSVYGIAEQNITGDSVKAFLEDSLTLLFANCRELNGSLETIYNRINQKGE